jgi:hypothetical protein
MSQQQQILKQELTVSQILSTYGKQFTQIQKSYSDGYNGRCAVGVIMSYYGWSDKADPDASRRLKAAFAELEREGISKDQMINLIKLNDSNMMFDEIANYLDGVG